jgi:hypothetical protein
MAYCPSATACLLGGAQSVAATRDSGLSWAKTVITNWPWKFPGGSDPTEMESLACPSANHCLAIEQGYDGHNSFSAIVVS